MEIAYTQSYDHFLKQQKIINTFILFTVKE